MEDEMESEMENFQDESEFNLQSEDETFAVKRSRGWPNAGRGGRLVDGRTS